MILMYRWDAGEALKIIERERVTSVGGVPVMARELITHPDFDRYDTSSLMAVSGGGAQLQPDLVGKIDARVKTARPGTGYGMTETCGIITAISGDFFVDRPESAGPAMPTFECKCVDDDGNTVPHGEVGELWVRAPVIRLYRADARRVDYGGCAAISASMTKGSSTIVDRKKGHGPARRRNVYCAEVEACVFRHPAVAECVSSAFRIRVSVKKLALRSRR